VEKDEINFNRIAPWPLEEQANPTNFQSDSEKKLNEMSLLDRRYVLHGI
jgi:hypothetical protein